MIGFPKRPLPCSVLALAVVLLCWNTPAARAQEESAQTQPEPGRAANESGGQTNSRASQGNNQESQNRGGAAGGGGGSGQRFDPATVSAGQAAFERSCTKCHDAARSLERTKDLAGWRATVRRMATKRDADIAPGDIEPISVYLASRTSGGGGGAAESAGGGGGAAAGGGGGQQGGAAAPSNEPSSSVTTFATLSPQWRGGQNDLQNPGFGPLTWFGAGWQGKVVSARVTICITCHGVQEPGLISRVEPVEAAARIDLSQFLEKHVMHGMKGSLDAGRFIVPFGAFSAQTDPSLYRTVSTPLIFNMGQRLFNQDLGFPVLPMPYADEGLNLNLSFPVGDCGTGPITLTTDSYLVNGLIGSGNGVDYFQSRDLFDNNNRVAGGCRVTLGDPHVRAGASFSTGRLDVPGTTVQEGLYYTIFGFDLQARYKRLLRFQAEYARRDSDRFGILPAGPGVFNEGVYGYYVEAEARPYDKCHVSLLTRYDWQGRSSVLPPSGSALPTGAFHVERLTFGINFELWQQSLLMFNYERWITPEPDHRNSDVFGVRYTITF